MASMFDELDLSEMCPRYEYAMEILGKKWTGLILRALLDRPRRFSEITSYVYGVSDRLASERLSQLEEEGIVERRVMDSRPVTTLYELTEMGEGLRPAVEAIQSWVDAWFPKEGPSKPNGRPLNLQNGT